MSGDEPVLEMARKRSHARGFLLSLMATALSSTNFITAKHGLEGFNPESFALVWTVAASVYAFGMVLATQRRRELALPARAVKNVCFMGLATGAGTTLAFAGFDQLDASLTALLWRFAPVITVVLGALIIGEALSVKELLFASVMVLGGCIAVTGKWDSVGMGAILTFLACCAAALQAVAARMEVVEVDPSVLVFYRGSVGALCIGTWALLTGRACFDADMSHWLATLLGALLGPCAAFFLIFSSYRHWGMSRSAVVSTTQPLFVVPLAYLFLGQLPSRGDLFGGSLILLGGLCLAGVQLRK